MTTLSNKISNLRQQAHRALKLADFWQGKIDVHGEQKAEALHGAVSQSLARIRPLSGPAFKSVEWEGLTLSRQPNDIEKIAVKAINEAQESGKELIAKVLLDTRKDLIAEAVAGLSEMNPGSYHELILNPPKAARKLLRSTLLDVYMRGRALVAEELEGQGSKAVLSLEPKFELWGGSAGGGYVKLDNGHNITRGQLYAEPTTVTLDALVRGAGVRSLAEVAQGKPLFKADDEDDLLDELTDLTLSRLSNSVQSRAIEIAASLATVGLVGSVLIERLESALAEMSERPEELTATGISNRVFAEGRKDEGEARSDEWVKVTYSALLDKNTCLSCSNEDGKESTDTDDLEPVPNVDCEGGSLCRCFWIYTFAEN